MTAPALDPSPAVGTPDPLDPRKAARVAALVAQGMDPRAALAQAEQELTPQVSDATDFHRYNPGSRFSTDFVPVDRPPALWPRPEMPAPQAADAAEVPNAAVPPAPLNPNPTPDFLPGLSDALQRAALAPHPAGVAPALAPAEATAVQRFSNTPAPPVVAPLDVRLAKYRAALAAAAQDTTRSPQERAMLQAYSHNLLAAAERGDELRSFAGGATDELRGELGFLGVDVPGGSVSSADELAKAARDGLVPSPDELRAMGLAPATTPVNPNAFDESFARPPAVAPSDAALDLLPKPSGGARAGELFAQLPAFEAGGVAATGAARVGLRFAAPELAEALANTPLAQRLALAETGANPLARTLARMATGAGALPESGGWLPNSMVQGAQQGLGTMSALDYLHGRASGATPGEAATDAAFDLPLNAATGSVLGPVFDATHEGAGALWRGVKAVAPRVAGTVGDLADRVLGEQLPIDASNSYTDLLNSGAAADGLRPVEARDVRHRRPAAIVDQTAAAAAAAEADAPPPDLRDIFNDPLDVKRLGANAVRVMGAEGHAYGEDAGTQIKRATAALAPVVDKALASGHALPEDDAPGALDAFRRSLGYERRVNGVIPAEPTKVEASRFQQVENALLKRARATYGPDIQPEDIRGIISEYGRPAVPAAEARTPNPDIRAAAERYNYTRNLEPPRPTPVTAVDETFAKKVADWYDHATSDPNDPKVRASYAAFRRDINDQYDYLTKDLGVRVEPTYRDPYATSAQMMTDVRQNHRLKVFAGSLNHPVLTPADNFKFRAVHDYFGHAKEGHQFGPVGEERAYREHVQMFSPEARPAMATETRGQNSWVNYGPHSAENRAKPGSVYADQKALAMPPALAEEYAPKSGSLTRVARAIGGLTVGAASAKAAESDNPTTQKLGELGLAFAAAEGGEGHEREAWTHEDALRDWRPGQVVREKLGSGKEASVITRDLAAEGKRADVQRQPDGTYRVVARAPARTETVGPLPATPTPTPRRDEFLKQLDAALQSDVRKNFAPSKSYSPLSWLNTIDHLSDAGLVHPDAVEDRLAGPLLQQQSDHPTRRLTEKALRELAAASPNELPLPRPTKGPSGFYSRLGDVLQTTDLGRDQPVSAQVWYDFLKRGKGFAPVEFEATLEPDLKVRAEGGRLSSRETVPPEGWRYTADQMYQMFQRAGEARGWDVLHDLDVKVLHGGAGDEGDDRFDEETERGQIEEHHLDRLRTHLEEQREELEQEHVRTTNKLADVMAHKGIDQNLANDFAAKVERSDFNGRTAYALNPNEVLEGLARKWHENEQGVKATLETFKHPEIQDALQSAIEAAADYGNMREQIENFPTPEHYEDIGPNVDDELTEAQSEWERDHPAGASPLGKTEAFGQVQYPGYQRSRANADDYYELLVTHPEDFEGLAHKGEDHWRNTVDAEGTLAHARVEVLGKRDHLIEAQSDYSAGDPHAERDAEGSRTYTPKRYQRRVEPADENDPRLRGPQEKLDALMAERQRHLDVLRTERERVDAIVDADPAVRALNGKLGETKRAYEESGKVFEAVQAENDALHRKWVEADDAYEKARRRGSKDEDELGELAGLAQKAELDHDANEYHKARQARYKLMLAHEKLVDQRSTKIHDIENVHIGTGSAFEKSSWALHDLDEERRDLLQEIESHSGLAEGIENKGAKDAWSPWTDPKRALGLSFGSALMQAAERGQREFTISSPESRRTEASLRASATETIYGGFAPAYLKRLVKELRLPTVVDRVADPSGRGMATRIALNPRTRRILLRTGVPALAAAYALFNPTKASAETPDGDTGKDGGLPLALVLGAGLAVGAAGGLMARGFLKDEAQRAIEGEAREALEGEARRAALPARPTGERVRPRDLARPADRSTLPNLTDNAIDRLGLPKPLADAVRDRAQQFNPRTAPVTHEATKTEAAALLGLSPDQLTNLDPRRMTGAEGLALASLAADRARTSAGLVNELKAKSLILNGPDQMELRAKIAQADDEFIQFLGAGMRGGSETGRNLNAYRILANASRSPEAWLMRAQRFLGSDRVLRPEEGQRIIDLVNGAHPADVVRYIAGLRKASVPEQVVTLLNADLFTSPVTRAYAFISGVSNLLTEYGPLAYPRAAFDYLTGVTLFRGERTIALPPLVQQWKGVGRGALTGLKESLDLMGWEAYKRGGIPALVEHVRSADVTPEMLARYDLPRLTTIDMLSKARDPNTPANQAVDFVQKAIYRSLAAPHRIVAAAAYEASLHEMAMAQAMNEARVAEAAGTPFDQRARYLDLATHPTDDLRTAAMYRGDEAAFQNAGMAAGVATGITHLASRATEKFVPQATNVVRAAERFIWPIARIPANAAARTADYTAIGGVRAAVDLFLAKLNDVKGNEAKVVEFRRKAAEAAARFATGTFGLMALGAWLESEGKMTGALPADAGERKQWDAENKKANSFLWHGQWVPVGRIPPIGTVLAMGATISALRRYNKAVGLGAQASAASRAALDQPYISGTNTLLDMLQDPEGGPGRFARNQVGRLVPPGLRRVTGALTGNEYRMPDNAEETIAAGVDPEGKLGLTGRIPARVGPWGLPVTGVQGMRGVFDPTQGAPDRTDSDPVLRELHALDYHPQGSARHPGEDNYTYEERAVAEGKSAYQSVRDLLHSDQYADAPKYADEMLDHPEQVNDIAQRWRTQIRSRDDLIRTIRWDMIRDAETEGRADIRAETPPPKQPVFSGGHK